MRKPPAISDAEWEVMTVLWEASPRTASEVADLLCGRMEWHPKTVKTLLSRLVRKGVLRYREEGNRYLYRPAIARERYIHEESQSFVDRVFGGFSTPMLVHFVKNTELSDDEIEALRQVLEQKKKETTRDDD
jgi:BlaI family penicillinase repressor